MRQWYLKKLQEDPLKTKMFTSGSLAALQEFLASWIAKDRNKSGHYFTSRVPKMAVYGAFISAPLGHVMISLLQKAFRGRTSLKSKILQIIVSNRAGGFVDRTASTDAYGRYAIRLPDGDWTVKVAMPSGRTYAVSQITVSGGQITDDLGSSVIGKVPNTFLPVARSTLTQRMPAGETNGVLGWSASATFAHALKIGAAMRPPWA